MKYVESETFQIKNCNNSNFDIKEYSRFNLFYGVKPYWDWLICRQNSVLAIFFHFSALIC